MVEKKMKALIRRERGLEQKNGKFALVAEKRWAAWLLKLKPL